MHVLKKLSRREFLRQTTLAAGGLLAGGVYGTPSPALSPAYLKTIPSSGEKICALGMGSFVTFNTDDSPPVIAQRTQVLKTFFDAGGEMIDSSPMYGASEKILGLCLKEIGDTSPLFAATKIWTMFDGSGPKQMNDSFRLWGVDTLDLQQVHNLLNWKDHLKTIRAARDEGRVRYIGVTTSHGRRHDELEAVMKREPLDFVQLTYNVLDREVEGRLLPLARDKGIAVIVNRPFRRGSLIDTVKQHPLPAWIEETGAGTWPQFLLKYIISHPAVTCAIPATSRIDHMTENMQALSGPMPDENMRTRMSRYVSNL